MIPTVTVTFDYVTNVLPFFKYPGAHPIKEIKKIAK